MSAILSGLRIVEISAFVAAPLGTMTLGQLGADVIRIDPIGGGIDYSRWPLDDKGNSLYWACLNKAKRSVCIDLKTGRGRELAQALVAAPGDAGGIAVTNFSEKGWLSYDRLKQDRADLILARLNGTSDGTTAVDYTVNCASGLPAITGQDDAYVNHVLPAWDVAAGLYIATGVLAAERHRSRTGQGAEVNLALFDVMLSTMSNLGFVAEAHLKRAPRQAIGNHLYGAFGRDFVTADGRSVMVAAITQGQWNALVRATGLGDRFAHAASAMSADIGTEGGRFAAREVLAAVLQDWCKTLTLAAVGCAFDAAGVLWGPYQTLDQLAHDDVRCSVANPLFAAVEHPDIGPLLTPGSPLSFQHGDAPRGRSMPVLGEHTDEVLAEVLKLSDGEIGQLHDIKVISGAPDTLR